MNRIGGESKVHEHCTQGKILLSFVRKDSGTDNASRLGYTNTPCLR